MRTAIPVRFRSQRARVLAVLARWERSSERAAQIRSWAPHPSAQLAGRAALPPGPALPSRAEAVEVAAAGVGHAAPLGGLGDGR